jgi:hypothetical protein
MTQRRAVRFSHQAFTRAIIQVSCGGFLRLLEFFLNGETPGRGKSVIAGEGRNPAKEPGH